MTLDLPTLVRKTVTPQRSDTRGGNNFVDPPSTITPRFCPLGWQARGANGSERFRGPTDTMTETETTTGDNHEEANDHKETALRVNRVHD